VQQASQLLLVMLLLLASGRMLYCASSSQGLGCDKWAEHGSAEIR
jgi:hypothetical protein